MRGNWRLVCAAICLAPAMLARVAMADPLPPVLDVQRLPTNAEAARVSYRDHFLIGNLPRAFALSSDGHFGGRWGSGTPEAAQQAALDSCKAKGGTDCRLYAADLAIVWPGREAAAPPPPPTAPLRDNGHYALIADPRFIWHGPQAARGVIVWGHGLDEHRRDLRGQQPPAYLRPLNNAGYDVVRFDRAPEWDGNTRLPEIVDWLREGLADLRHQGWRHIVAAGQSRGGINVLNLLRTPGLADVLLTTSAAMAGTDAVQVATRGEVNLYETIKDTPTQSTRVMYVQFEGDPFAGDEDRRAARMREMVGPHVSALVLIDRPSGFSGHSAANGADFAEAFSACIAHFVMDAMPPQHCDKAS